jgi:hypothetical protein
MRPRGSGTATLYFLPLYKSLLTKNSNCRNPRHPSLHLKQVGKFWSVRVGLRYPALGVSAPDSIIWFWIGSHKDYDLLIG